MPTRNRIRHFRNSYELFREGCEWGPFQSAGSALCGCPSRVQAWGWRLDRTLRLA